MQSRRSATQRQATTSSKSTKGDPVLQGIAGSARQQGLTRPGVQNHASSRTTVRYPPSCTSQCQRAPLTRSLRPRASRPKKRQGCPKGHGALPPCAVTGFTPNNPQRQQRGGRLQSYPDGVRTPTRLGGRRPKRSQHGVSLPTNSRPRTADGRSTARPKG